MIKEKEIKKVELEPVDDLALPTEPHEAEVNISTCILFGKEKCGKTTALASLPNCLIIDTERGSKMVKALAMLAPEDRGPVGKMQWLKRLAERIKKEGEGYPDGKKYDYIAIDTLTEVNDWAEWSGTFRYMNTTQGKSFNRVKDSKGNPIRDGAFLDPLDDDYQSVHTLPDGNGYRWSRDEVLRIYEMFVGLARKCVFFVCHIEDKFVGLKDTTDIVVPKQLALTGKLRDILPRRVDAIGYVYHEKGETKVNFSTNEERTGGTRGLHLRGFNDVIDWTKIFI